MARGDPHATAGGGRLCLVFAYGSNLDEARMRARVPSTRFLACASLARHRLRFHKRGSIDGTGKANAFRTGSDADVVHGVVYEVDPAHLPDLDRHEGGYRRELMAFTIAAADGGSELVEAWVYLAEADFIDDTLEPEEWYLEHVRRGTRAHGLPIWSGPQDVGGTSR